MSLGWRTRRITYCCAEAVEVAIGAEKESAAANATALITDNPFHAGILSIEVRRSRRPTILLGIAAARNTSAERRDLSLPLLAEGQHQHLLIDVAVLGQAAHRTAA